MPKSTEVPAELKEFNRVFEELCYHFQYADTFNDFLDYSIACFLPTGDKELVARLEKKYAHRYTLFRQLFSDWIITTNRVLQKREWYDALGCYYEVLSSESKASALGQFFTPHELCDVMAGLQYSGVEAGKTVYDPAAGSGRLLLAVKVLSPGAVFYACDIDYLCAKMTALNMVIHGCQGQVVCGDSFWLDQDWRFGYQINALLNITGYPHLAPIEKEQCRQVKTLQGMVKEAKAQPKPSVKPPEFQPSKTTFGEQLFLL
ncbi:N-6 DNA methylase [Siphonobacter sp. SORGH_AS_0500]|uniref:N-6 DNA methylase n=1 Tax=Siphonobacter sp. SORGH_AS_0500 TaxID=1864824 RepID=UPI0028673D1A|nr:N-6 DNA methylase [Siphonobacter sp. SORGH_AS_0500]MDR6194726.1 type I restriction enzyme M protein [Siphonobacter sp. SORGH_AS_0500]